MAKEVMTAENNYHSLVLLVASDTEYISFSVASMVSNSEKVSLLNQLLYVCLTCMQIDNLSSTLAPILIELLQTNIPAGVEMTIKQVI